MQPNQAAVPAGKRPCRCRWIAESVMPGQINIQPEPFAFEAEGEWHLERTASQPLPVRARDPLAGARIPRGDCATTAWLDRSAQGNPSRSICVLIRLDKRTLSNEDVVRYLRIVPWRARGRRRGLQAPSGLDDLRRWQAGWPHLRGHVREHAGEIKSLPSMCVEPGPALRSGQARRPRPLKLPRCGSRPWIRLGTRPNPWPGFC